MLKKNFFILKWLKLNSVPAWIKNKKSCQLTNIFLEANTRFDLELNFFALNFSTSLCHSFQGTANPKCLIGILSLSIIFVWVLVFLPGLMCAEIWCPKKNEVNPIFWLSTNTASNDIHKKLFRFSAIIHRECYMEWRQAIHYLKFCSSNLQCMGRRARWWKYVCLLPRRLILFEYLWSCWKFLLSYSQEIIHPDPQKSSI